MAKKNNMTAVDLGAKVRVIPVLVYGHEFQIKITQREMRKFLDKLETKGVELEKKMEATGDNDWDKMKGYLSESLDVVLGDGAGKEILETEDDPLLLTETFYNIGEYLKAQLEQVTRDFDKKKAQQVIEAKKNKTTNASQSSLPSSSK
ncbi:hypothetical protein [Paucilactobacillus nenjiangensis]|uniref:Uncharacterized protein n=1 Tax=Paucilactobacillus nenjiangensis TaxID=1296540 RepID=A0A5P1X5L2_9LACO|nr:hypothetical protein [Paucilactobacillus nenjiangensis]QER67578.1 hypothetical protein F0161_06710 [Paucilactobacillus nenjiangensis]